MNVLLAHNFYASASPSGENMVFLAEKALLEKNGIRTATFIRHSDSIYAGGYSGTLKAALGTAWNPFAVAAMKRLVKVEQPDVVHVHNTFPLLSPAIFAAIDRPAARVMTLHNYRAVCPAAIPMRNRKPCTKCMDQRSALPSILHACYRNSRIATLPLAIASQLHRWLGTWNKDVDAFIVLSEFQRDLMVSTGFPAEKLHVKPNFSAVRDKVVPWCEREPYVVFAGRLSSEKGVVSLLQAWRYWGADAPELRIIGDGELRLELLEMARGLPVRFLGQVPPEEVQRQVSRARLQVLPSEWYETFGLVVIEAFAHATPAAVSRIGALPSIVQQGRNGIVFEPGDPWSMLSKIREAWYEPGELERLGQRALIDFEEKYTESVNYSFLMDIYLKAMEQSRYA